MRKNAVLPLVMLVFGMFVIKPAGYCQLPSSPSKTDIYPLLDANNVSWNVPGPTSAQSMPIGNGDIGLNVWVEENGDLAFYISKTDAWGGTKSEQDSWMKQGGVLMKLGLVRISLSPSPFAPGANFNQLLKLRDGEIIINEGNDKTGAKYRIWVDANHPVIRVEAESKRPVRVKVQLENWRANRGNSNYKSSNYGDSVLSGQDSKIAWYHQNSTEENPHLSNLIFGAAIKGVGLQSQDAFSLQSAKDLKTTLISIYPLTATVSGADQFLTKLKEQVLKVDQLDFKQTQLAHRKWWGQFWHRSWVFVHGNQNDDQDAGKQVATDLTQGYILQRFITAAAGRGAYPIKFNGSIFNVDYPEWKRDKGAAPVKKDADYRDWGGQYWFQNTRAMYWPRLMAGDFDMMLPFFKMYADMLPANSKQVKQFYQHEGAYFAETAPFWGGLPNVGPEAEAHYTNHYFTPILELSMMMLDYYAYTGDQKFARETLMPVATAGLKFFYQHFGKDQNGKLLLDPDNSAEMFWKVRNPAPDIAGLHAVLKRMVMLSPDLVDQQALLEWKKMQQELPELPIANQNGNRILLPYEGEQTAKGFNSENPELYSIYPFRIYNLDQPDLDLAIHSFNSRKFKDKGCWTQDVVQAAMLGLNDIAKEYVTYTLTRKEPRLKFPAFWARGNDYAPDQDNGGNGENGLQQMLMQTEGKRILLLPAWPKEWNADFKLNAPYQTTVSGQVKNGKLTNLTVVPASRRKDVTVLMAK